MKKILIPTDFSDTSKNSVIYAFELAHQLQCEVELIHVLEIYKYAAGTSEAELISTILPSENIQEMEDLAKKSFESFMLDINSKINSSVPYRTRVVSGHLVNEIIVQSAIPEYCLLVLAVSSSQDLATRFTHNTISAILSDAGCPVIIVPSNYSYKTIQKVVLATDFNSADLDIIQKFLNMFNQLNPELTILHVTNKSIDFKLELKMAGMKQLVYEKIKYNKVNFKLTTAKNIVQGIIEEAKNADLLIMLKEHEGFIKSLFEASKVEKITHFLKIPMLSFRQDILG